MLDNENQDEPAIKTIAKDGYVFSPAAVRFQREYMKTAPETAFLKGRVDGLKLLLSAVEEGPYLYLQDVTLKQMKWAIAASAQHLDQLKYTIKYDYTDGNVPRAACAYSGKKVPVPNDELIFTDEYLTALFSNKHAAGMFEAFNVYVHPEEAEIVRAQLEEAERDFAFRDAKEKVLQKYVDGEGYAGAETVKTKINELVEKTHQVDLEKMLIKSDTIGLAGMKSAVDGVELGSTITRARLHKLDCQKQECLGETQGIIDAQKIIKGIINAATQSKDNARGQGE